MSAFGQFAATTQFYLYGKKHCTRTGYENASKNYADAGKQEEKLDLKGKCYMVTGANSGVGKEVATYLASKQATVYMVCRNPARAEAARAEIVEKTKSDRVRVLLADVSLEKDIRRIMTEFTEDHGETALDALVCNAGAMAHERTLTEEGVEITFASHLLFGTYLLGYLAMPLLKKAKSGGRLVVVSSGGMYNSAFPEWEIATAQKGEFNRQLAYAYAKRGQVLLCERWAVEYPMVQCVSCHPGWTDTPAVNAAYSAFEKSLLEPMRTPWQGAEGIAWLCVADNLAIDSGSFYLDRKPQVKHLAGPFFTEGTFTKNSVSEVDVMMQQLHSWSHGGVPVPTPQATASPTISTTTTADDDAAQDDATPTITPITTSTPPPPGPLAMATPAERRAMPLKAMDKYVDLLRFMGTWYCTLNIPIPVVEAGACNAAEIYDWNAEKQQITVTYKYTKPDRKGVQGKVQQFLQRGTVTNRQTNAEWRVQPKVGPFHAPIKFAYLIIDCAPDYSTAIIGMPDRSCVWVLSRSVEMEEAVVQDVKRKIQKAGYDVSQLQRVPHTADIASKDVGVAIEAGGCSAAIDSAGAEEAAGDEP